MNSLNIILFKIAMGVLGKNVHKLCHSVELVYANLYKRLLISVELPKGNDPTINIFQENFYSLVWCFIKM